MFVSDVVVVMCGEGPLLVRVGDCLSRLLLTRCRVVLEWHGVAKETRSHRLCWGQGWLHLTG